MSVNETRATAGWAGAFAKPPGAQAVEIKLGGIRYPGEVIFADSWEAVWGGPLAQSAMFRVVFLASPSPVSSGDIEDDRIAVVTPSGDAPPELRPVVAEAAAPRETRAGYAVSTDPGLSRLAHAIEVREGELAVMAAESVGRCWADGAVISRGNGPDLGTLLPALERSGPEAWIEALGSWLVERGTEGDLLRSVEPLTEEMVASVFEMVAGQNPEPDPRVRAVAHSLGLGDSTPGLPGRFESGIDALLETDGKTTGPAVRSLVLSTLGAPLEVGALMLTDYVHRRDAELTLDPAFDTGLPRRINHDTLPDTPWERRLLERLTELRSAISDDWDAALPYLTAIDPLIGPLPNDADESPDDEFTETLCSAESRVSLTAAIVARLERTLGVQSGWSLGRLAAVVGAESWREFTASARETFDNALAFRAALAQEPSARTLAAHALEIERSVVFLDATEFGAEHRSLELEARTLRARFDAGLLDDVDRVWPALRSEFDRWRTDYRNAYRRMHARRRMQDEELQRKMARAIVQLAAVEGFAQLPELGPPLDSDLTMRYEELAVSLEPCQLLEHDVPLSGHPFCETCGITMRSQADREDIDAFLFELESVLRSYNRHLSSVAVREGLANRQPERLTRLLRLRDAADLSALSDHLSGDVIEFLGEFLVAAGSQD
ncbi:MAG: hypothetical protein O3C10_04095 [Chloroflexi bacterium]|nr:hypothetical protein [Chloroflexota bacterium]